ncbi:Bicaudal C [Operophtera brumata]|uniref:Bicaudal C n=1 Tax=Operophtera brumata TaxID=104452 RepID=A0A0L7KWQ1_OPEBR|nr:Bicaudal C [Operophtera brumata]
MAATLIIRLTDAGAVNDLECVSSLTKNIRVSKVFEFNFAAIASGQELQKLVVILGLNSAEDVYQERFRVDRRRLEAMLADPHVRVAGRIDDVKQAREKIMQLLDTRGGLTIKRVMEETGCHIHFPDSNRTSTVEKSNQVSIAGDMERVERARARVRVSHHHIHFPDSNRTSTVEKSNQVSIAGDMERVERARARVRVSHHHIHFPDSNRTSTVEKSNQVSIAGDVERVERARARVRVSTHPLRRDSACTLLRVAHSGAVPTAPRHHLALRLQIQEQYNVQLPIVAPSQPLPDITSPYVLQIQEQYNVQLPIVAPSQPLPDITSPYVLQIQEQYNVQTHLGVTPLVFCFELPIVAPSQPLPDITSPYVLQIQEQYNVQDCTR